MTALYLAVVILGWSFWHLASKQASNYLHPLAVQTVYATCGAITAPLFYYLIPKTNRWQWQGISWACAAYIATTLATLAYVSVLTKNNVSSVVGIASAYPIITFLAAVLFMNESFSYHKLIGLVLVLAGVFISSK